MSVLQPLSSRNTRLFALNPEIMPFHAFRFSATSGTLLLAGMKRFLLPPISQLQQRLSDRLDADGEMQCVNDLLQRDIGFVFYQLIDAGELLRA